MTHRELATELDSLDDNLLQNDVTVYIEVLDEYYPVKEFVFTDADDDVLDNGHPLLVV